MKFFRPHFQIATLAGEQDRFVSKIGGLPWGFPVEHWPVCCGQPQRLLVQMRHEPPMLDLGSPGAVLHLFQCLECAGIDDGGRDTVLLHESDLGKGLVAITGHDSEPELGNCQIGEFWIDGWEAADDGIPDARLPEFFDEKSVWKLQDEFPQVDWFDGKDQTRFGGSPRWTGNGPDYEPPPFEFLFQLNHRLYLDGVPPHPNQVGCGVIMFGLPENGRCEQSGSHPDAGCERPNAPWWILHEQGNDYHFAKFTNLGSDGVAYVFIDRTQQPHAVKWLWRR